MKEKRIVLKGYTLLELIVVMAMFVILLGVVLGMIWPANSAYKSASESADAQNITESLRGFVEGHLEYSDRIDVYTNMSLGDDAIVNQVADFRERFYFTPQTEASTGDTLSRIAPCADFKDEIYVMQIDNPEPGELLATNKYSESDMIGTVRLRKFVNGVEEASFAKTWSQGSDYYEDYAFLLNMNVAVGDQMKALNESTIVDGKVSPSNLALGIKFYKKERIKGDLKNSTLKETKLTRTVAFKLRNIVNSIGTISDEKVPMIRKNSAGDEIKTTESVRRFTWYDNVYTTNATTLEDSSGTIVFSDPANGIQINDICFIFTKSPVIEQELNK